MEYNYSKMKRKGILYEHFAESVRDISQNCMCGVIDLTRTHVQATCMHNIYMYIPKCLQLAIVKMHNYSKSTNSLLLYNTQ